MWRQIGGAKDELFDGGVAGSETHFINGGSNAFNVIYDNIQAKLSKGGHESKKPNYTASWQSFILGILGRRLKSNNQSIGGQPHSVTLPSQPRELGFGGGTEGSEAAGSLQVGILGGQGH